MSDDVETVRVTAHNGTFDDYKASGWQVTKSGHLVVLRGSVPVAEWPFNCWARVSLVETKK